MAHRYRELSIKGQTGQQLLVGAYQALSRQIEAGQVEMHTRSDMLDLIVVDGWARGIVTRCLRTGKTEAHRRCRSAGKRRLRERFLPFDECEGE